MKMVDKKRCCIVSFLITFGLFGIALTIWGFIGPSFIDKKLQSGIIDNLVITSENSTGYKLWHSNAQDDVPPLYWKAYFLNLTNPEDFMSGKSKPIFQQIGPYSYKENQVKFNISFLDDGDQIQYKLWQYFVFDEETSNGNPYVDKVTTLNIPVQGVITQLGDEWYSKLGFDILCSMAGANCSLISSYVVNDLLWGYEDPFLKFLSKFQPSVNPIFQLQVNQTSMDEADESTGYSIIYSGKSNLTLLRTYSQWNGNSTLNVWGSPECNELKGTDGTQFHPNVSQNETLIGFVDSIFRSGNLASSSSVEVEGIKLYEFNILPRDLLNATLYPPNACYYQFGPSGVQNMTKPIGIPLFMSKPMFLDADPIYLDQVIGLAPNRTLHETIVDVEPITGATMRAYKRLQVNVKIDPLMILYQNINMTYFPIVWIEEGSCITPSLAKQFKDQVYLAITMKTVFKWGGWCGGGAFVLISVIALIYNAKQIHRRKGYERIIQ